MNSPSTENGTHEYTVPLNDLQPKQGLSLTDQIKAAQFYGILPSNDRWATNANEISSNQDGRFLHLFLFFHFDRIQIIIHQHRMKITSIVKIHLRAVRLYRNAR